MRTLSLKLTFGIFAASVVLAGCGPDPVASMGSAQAGTAPTLTPFKPVAQAGIKVDPADPTVLIEAGKAQAVAVRGNPFSLRSEETAFDRSQAVASLVEGQGWYPFVAIERAEPGQETFVMEPQPPRRLAGVLIGETITALIDMGDGRGLQTIRPGQTIEGTNWVVQSIDEEKAILRREGSNTRPKYVVVRLEDAATMGSGSGGAAPATGGGNTRGGGMEGGGAAGRPE